jgi:5-methyltetrahydrofolate--homocysteine methyltransferase
MLLIGERINAEGSRTVRRLLLAHDYDAIVSIGREQIDAGAQALDVCAAMRDVPGEDERLRRLVTILRESFPATPLFIDSADRDVLRRSLAYASAPFTLNSINLAAGRGALDEIVPLAKDHDARLVVGCIDEGGMARTCDRKLEVARRICDIAIGTHGLAAEYLFIDPLVFARATDAIDQASDETVAAIAAIKRECPGVRTIAGISDVSYGLPPEARALINAAFLKRCAAAGLDAAIVNVAQNRGVQSPAH